MLGFLIEWLRSLLFTRYLDVCIVGLPGAGKTTLTNVLVTGRVPEHVAPTVGYNLRQLRVGNPRFRSMWERYCSGVSAVLFAVDSSIPLPPGYSTKDQGEYSEEEKTARNRESEAWNIAAEELHSLIQRPALAGLPLLVLATKNDLPNPASVQEVISVMDLASLKDREVYCYSISTFNQTNIGITIKWLCAKR